MVHQVSGMCYLIVAETCSATNVWVVTPEGKDTTRVAAGLKAAIHNPNVSEEAKERAADKLEQIGSGMSAQIMQGGHDTNRVLGGYKATLTVRIRSRMRFA